MKNSNRRTCKIPVQKFTRYRPHAAVEKIAEYLAIVVQDEKTVWPSSCKSVFLVGHSRPEKRWRNRARKGPRACTNESPKGNESRYWSFPLSSTRESSERCSESEEGALHPKEEAQGASKAGGERFFGQKAWHPSKEEGKLDDCSVQLRWRLGAWAMSRVECVEIKPTAGKGAGEVDEGGKIGSPSFPLFFFFPFFLRFSLFHPLFLLALPSSTASNMAALPGDRSAGRPSRMSRRVHAKRTNFWPFKGVSLNCSCTASNTDDDRTDIPSLSLTWG